jgi:threonine dehydrogenase-like Zn-dependent dehydrogenase
MRDLFLYGSGILGLAAALLHGVLGETRVFARVRIEPERLRLLLRLVWHCSVVA